MPERRRRAEYMTDSYAPVGPAVEQHEEQMVPPARDLVATNTGVRLACAMSAMIGLFAIFLCWAEKESRVIRRFSVQSAALTAAHGAVGALMLLISAILGGIPFIGLMVSLVCLLCYIAVLIVLIAVRIRLMKHAWEGVRFAFPGQLEKLLQRFY